MGVLKNEGGVSMQFEDLLKQANKKLKEAKKLNEKIADILINELKDIIPDLKYTIGWAEAGIETICLYSDEFKYRFLVNEYTFLDWTIEEALPEFKKTLSIQSPFGIRITKEEAEKIKEKLKKLRNKKIS